MKTSRLFIHLGIIIFIFFLMPFSAIANPDVKPEELKQMEISDGFIEPKSKNKVGFIRTITGKGRLIVLHSDDRRAYYAKKGDPVYEKDALYTVGDCRSRIEFKDKNVVIVAPDTHLNIDEISSSFFKEEKRSRFSLLKGKAIFYALKLLRYKTMKFDVITPNAAIGVRGTKFGAEIVKENTEESYLMNRRYARLYPVLAQTASDLDNLITRTYVLEGEVSVRSLVDGRIQMLSQNEILEADRRGLGEVIFDPARTESFVKEVTSGIEVTETIIDKKIIDDRINRQQLDMMDKLPDIQQRMREMPSHNLPSQGGGQHP